MVSSVKDLLSRFGDSSVAPLLQNDKKRSPSPPVILSETKDLGLRLRVYSTKDLGFRLRVNSTKSLLCTSL